jgi:putative transposase
MLNLKLLGRFLDRLVSVLERIILKLTKLSRRSLALSIASNLTLSKSQLIAENALLRQQLIILCRQVNKPHFAQSERIWLVLLAS